MEIIKITSVLAQKDWPDKTAKSVSSGAHGKLESLPDSSSTETGIV